jgi:hypothetical protein
MPQTLASATYILYTTDGKMDAIKMHPDVFILVDASDDEEE